MKKIAIVTTGVSKILTPDKCGGGEIVFKHLIIELAKMSDIDLYIYTPVNDPNLPEIKQDFPGIKFIEVDEHPYYSTYIRKIEELIQDENFDKIINYNTFLPYKTTIFQAHSFVHKCNYKISLFSRIKKYLIRKRLAQQARMYSNLKPDMNFIAVSKIIKNDYSKNFDIKEELIKIAYPGVESVTETYNELTQNPCITFGIVANSSINKGGHYLLFALGLLKLLRRNFKLKLIATKYDKDILMKAIINLFGYRKDVEVLSFQQNMSDFYNAIDVLVVPSQNEAFGLVTLEAMAHEKPVILSSNAGSAEIMNENNGFIFDRSSFKAFLNTLDKVIKLYEKDFSKFQQISKNAWLTSKEFTWEKFAKKVIE